MCSRLMSRYAYWLVSLIIVLFINSHVHAADIEIPLKPGASDQTVTISFHNPTIREVRDLKIRVETLPGWASNAQLSQESIEQLEIAESVDITLRFDINKEIDEHDAGDIEVRFELEEEQGELDTYFLTIGPSHIEVEEAGDTGGTGEAVNDSGGNSGGTHRLLLTQVHAPQPFTLDENSAQGKYVFTHEDGSLGISRYNSRSHKVGPGEKGAYYTRTTTVEESTGFTKFPKMIELGSPFTIETSLRAQRTVTNRWCVGKEQWTPQSFVRIRKRDTWVRSAYRTSYHAHDAVEFSCADTSQLLPEVTLGAESTLKIECSPVENDEEIGVTIAASYRVLYEYDCTVESETLSKYPQSYRVAFYWPLVEADELGNFKGQNNVELNSHVLIEMGFNSILHPSQPQEIALEYAPDTTSSEALNPSPYTHPFELKPDWQQPGTSTSDADSEDGTSGVADSDGTPSDGEDGTEEDALGNGSNADSPDPSTLDPNNPNIAALISQWTSSAEPPINAKGGNAQYTQWGSLEGQLIGGKTVRVDRPDAAAGMTPEAYVWSIRAKLDSINHCKLEEYVLANLAHESIDHCQGRYQEPQGIQVQNVVGLPGAKARTILEGQGLEVKISMGKPAANEAQALTVAGQDRKPSTTVAPDTVITLTVFGEFQSLITIPSVAGVPSTAARNQLVAAGFKVEVRSAGKAPEAKVEFTVKSSTPPSNTEVKPGSLVVIHTYGPIGEGNFTGLEKNTDCPYDAKKSGNLGKTVSCQCSAKATTTGAIYGTGFYTDDSSVCRAALHAGEVTTAGGKISFTIRKGQPHYDSTSSHGVTSGKWGSYSGHSFAFRDLSDVKARCPSSASKYRGTGKVVSCECTAEAASKGTIYGNEFYTDDSHICRAGVHAGKITSEGGGVVLSMREGQPSYEGTMRNGVTSQKWGSFSGSFTFAGALDSADNDGDGSGPRQPADDEPLTMEPLSPKMETDQTMEVGVNFPGSDFNSFFPEEAQPRMCQVACENNERCRAWSYVKPRGAGGKAKCWLKHSVPVKKNDACCISGVSALALKEAAEAQLGAKTCSNVSNMKSGKEWRFPWSLGVSSYYQHADYLCHESGEKAMKVEAKKLVGYTCLKKWQSCKRAKNYDADVIYPAEDYKWGKRWFLKLKMKWRGMNERELYIEKK